MDVHAVKRIRLPTDAQLAQVSQQAYFVRANTKLTQLPEVLSAFGLNPGKRDLLSRCVKCNGNFKAT